MGWKCIKLIVDKNNWIVKVEDGKDKFTEENFIACGYVINKNKKKICDFTIDEETLNDNSDYYNCYILVREKLMDSYLKNDGEIFKGCFVNSFFN